jgi:O-antigen ligase
LLILGMVLASGVNHDGVTLYQALKLLVIGVLCWVMWRLAARTDTEFLFRALYGVLVLVTLFFFLSKAFSSASYSLGGSREGDVFARAGVLWKAGLFFLPLFIADWLCNPRRWVAAACAIGACLFLVSVDGSRTGLLLIVAVGLGFGIVLWWRRDWRTVRRRPWALPLAAGVLLALLLLNAGMNAWKRGNLAGTSSTGSSQVEALVNQAIAPVVDNRLGEGDAPRLRLLRNGLEKSRECFPLGCGFGSTAIDAGYGIPMNVHNAYLGALADFGLLGLLGMLGFVVASVLPMRVLWDRSADPGRVYFVLATSGSALAYCVALNLHTFSTEMSEWGYLLLMLAFAWRPARVS